MRRLRRSFLLVVLLISAALASAQVMEWEEDPNAPNPRPVKLAPAPKPDHTVYLRCGAMWDGREGSAQLEQNVVITVQGERIKSIGKFSPPPGSEVVDLAN